MVGIGGMSGGVVVWLRHLRPRRLFGAEPPMLSFDPRGFVVFGNEAEWWLSVWIGRMVGWLLQADSSVSEDVCRFQWASDFVLHFNRFRGGETFGPQASRRK